MIALLVFLDLHWTESLAPPPPSSSKRNESRVPSGVVNRYGSAKTFCLILYAYKVSYTDIDTFKNNLIGIVCNCNEH